MTIANQRSVGVSAQGYALIDVTSGRILSGRKGDERMRIASLTKVMTAIVAIEHGKLSDLVKVSRNAYAKEGSSLYLKLGEEMSLENLLYGLMLRSGNDAAVAIAEHVGQSLEGFVYMMNAKAEEIGMSNTHFDNPHGLDTDTHFSSANDMAKLTAYALHNPVFRQISGTKLRKAPNPNESWDYVWRNKNKMLFLYEGADGGKTGYTKLSGRTLISSATRGTQQLAVVTLNAPSDWSDHRQLFDYGFAKYPLREIAKAGDPVENTAFVTGRDFLYPLGDEEVSGLTKSVEFVPPETPDYILGYRGKITIQLKGQSIGTIPVVEKNSPLSDVGAFAHEASPGAVPFTKHVMDVLRVVFTGNTQD
ncbi:peptidase M15 [Paenibacillus swuensis]|uniref:Peptidase M15 n=2 Tax=Paenibacillus swuensis TaxID=1178515 RepID=A0A172TPT8_9BACL|nr:D-alanyl-D-alanine carboxypeptidase family protein [Paenibacillus swuensis]ANE49030.1 peptidase M15 [Paenibacillus swuensis]